MTVPQWSYGSYKRHLASSHSKLKVFHGANVLFTDFQDPKIMLIFKLKITQGFSRFVQTLGSTERMLILTTKAVPLFQV